MKPPRGSLVTQAQVDNRNQEQEIGRIEQAPPSIEGQSCACGNRSSCVATITACCQTPPSVLRKVLESFVTFTDVKSTDIW